MKKQGQSGWDSISGALRGIPVENINEVVSHFSTSAAQWYAVQTRYRFERKVTSQLERQGFETFLPLLKEVHRWSDRQKSLDTLLFPGYTFVRLDPAPLALRKMVQAGGVIGLIKFAGEAAQVPAKQIDDLRKLLSQRVPFAMHPFLKVGQKVRIRDGSLDGLEGILEETGEKNSSSRSTRSSGRLQ